MNYQDTVDYLFSKLPIYQRLGTLAYKKNIGNIIKASQIISNPHLNFKSIHIAGTNGKGSTAHMIASILQESGLKVGLYTSPHLKDFRERIKINGKVISKNDVINFINKHFNSFNNINMSFFEMTVAMAFNHFSKYNVDIAVIETGLGGRLDSTNIINPEISIITNISLDHTNLLGKTIEEITKEKAGIIKKNTPVIIGRDQKEIKNIFHSIAKENNSEILYAKQSNNNYYSDLNGDYQKENINTSVCAINKLQSMGWKISDNNIINGLKNCKKNTLLKGRWDTINNSPLTICDTGHNKDGMKQVITQISNIDYLNLHFIFGTVNDKNIDEILSLLPKKAMYYFCKPNIERGLSEFILYQKSKKYSLIGNYYKSVKEAYNSAKNNANKKDLIFIGGSTFIVSEII